MCGICGIFDTRKEKRADENIVKKMTARLLHRGPDGSGYYTGNHLALGFTRLSIIDLAGGMQPIFNEDNTLVSIANGEIFNYIEIRRQLQEKGHRFKTNTDVEVLLHLYEEMDTAMLNRLNGQFAFVIFDIKKQQLFCARDHFGIIPFFYTIVDDLFIFASEIKAILEHPRVSKQVDLVGLDQVFSFPGLICPRTMFKNIRSLENGHYLIIDRHGRIEDSEYWDLVYPKNGEIQYHQDEARYSEKLSELLTRSVELRLRSDVPVGFYISGGLDSALVSAIAAKLHPDITRCSFSIDFEEKDKSEARYQRILANHIRTQHYEKLFLYPDIGARLKKVVYHAEYPLKESYNTASLALSEAAHQQNIKVVLNGEGADEWFAGYPGYKFDKFRQMQAQNRDRDPAGHDETQINREMWGQAHLHFDIPQYAFRKIKKALYSEYLNTRFNEFDSLKHQIVNKEKLEARDPIHQRSYLDFKLRLVAHLISDHGDRMTYANSVEGRYPFLDKELVEFAALIPPALKLNGFEEKYILKKIAANIVPAEIIKREKFAFHAPGSPYLLKRNSEYIDDLLSYETIKRQGYFNPDTIEKLKKQYTGEGFRLNIPYESDLLITVLTLGIFLEAFQMPVI